MDKKICTHEINSFQKYYLSICHFQIKVDDLKYPVTVG